MSDLITALLGDVVGRWFLYFGAVVVMGLWTWRAARGSRKKLEEIGQDLGLVKHEVKNNHSTNLREEADVRHDENARKLDWLIQAVTRIQGDVQNLYTNDTQARAQLEELERTIDRRPS